MTQAIVPTMTTFNLLGGLFYLGVAIVAAFAARRPEAWLRRSGLRNARLHWWGVAALFAGLAAWRLGLGEARVQEWARLAALADNTYGERRAWQGQVIAAALLLGAAGAWWLARSSGESRRVRWSRMAALALLGYSAVRAISFHPIDAVIYAAVGPISINHLLDTALALFVALCAAESLRRSRPVAR